MLILALSYRKMEFLTGVSCWSWKEKMLQALADFRTLFSFYVVCRNFFPLFYYVIALSSWPILNTFFYLFHLVMLSALISSISCGWTEWTPWYSNGYLLNFDRYVIYFEYLIFLYEKMDVVVIWSNENKNKSALMFLISLPFNFKNNCILWRVNEWNCYSLHRQRLATNLTLYSLSYSVM